MNEIAWIAWAVAALALSGQQFSWQVAYFKSPGPQFYRIFVGLLAVSPVGFAAYLWLRRHSWWRYEVAMLAAIPLAAALVYQTRAGWWRCGCS